MEEMTKAEIEHEKVFELIEEDRIPEGYEE